MNKADFYLKENIENILKHGYKDENPRPKYEDGTPAYTYSVNHVVRTYNLAAGEFPITCLRPIAWKAGIKEILWIYQDASNDLDVLNNKYKVHYWNDWESADLPNTIGQRYGATVKRYDLVNNLIKDIHEDPYGRRKVMSLWQENDLRETDGLAPCAFMTIWNVRGRFLDMALIQRSGDYISASGAGGINEVQYAALLMMIARHTGYHPGVFTHFVANEQIYDRHLDISKELLNRFEQRQAFYNSIHPQYHMRWEYKKEDIDALNEMKENYIPKMTLNPQKTDFHEFTVDDFVLKNYEPIKPQFKIPLGI